MADELPNAPWAAGRGETLPDAPWSKPSAAAELNPEAPPPQSWANVATSAVKNIPSSAVDFGKSMVQPIIHPIETATNLKNVAQGAMEKAGMLSGDEHTKYADAVGQFFSDRYGGMENFKRTLAHDPVGFAADLSTVLSGGGSLGARLPGMLGKAGEIAAQAGRVVDPINAAATVAVPVARGAAKMASETIGGLTHTGAMPLESAARAGYEGGQAGKTFQENLRGTAPMEDTVDEARKAVQNMRAARGAAYRADMQGLSANQATYPGIWADIGNAAQRAGGVKTFKGQDLSPKTLATRQEIADAITHWHSLPPADFHTLEGFDALKQKIGDIRDGTEHGTPERRIADEMYRGVRNAIVKADPAYGKTMKAYEEASHQLREIDKTLSLGKNRSEGASVDTALRKLQSTLRDNVNTSFGRRRELLQYLLDNGSPHLMEALAGQALKPWLPRGLGRLGMQLGAEMLALGGAHAAAGPGALAAGVPMAAAMSPRLMGESAYYAGKAAKYIEAASQYAPPRSAYQAGRLQLTVGPRGLADEQQPPQVAERARGGRITGHQAAVTRRESHYSAKAGTPERHCGGCAHFVKPNACEKVGGHIAAKGLCDWYRPARAAGGRVGYNDGGVVPLDAGAPDAFETAAQRVRAPYAKANARESGLPQVLEHLGNKIASAATAPQDAYTGKMQVSNPATGMPTPEAMQRAQGVAGLAMTGGMPMAQEGALGMAGGKLMQPDPLASLRAGAQKASQDFTKSNLPPPKNILDRAWDNYTKRMDEAEALASEAVWGTAANLAKEKGTSEAAAFARVMNDWYKRKGIDKRMTEDAANAYTGRERANAQFEALMKQRASGGRVLPHYVDPNPSEAQKAAGNYRKAHVTIHGLDIAIENPKGGERSGVGKDGKPWSVKMPSHYGYIKGTVGKDKDHVDVYVGPHVLCKRTWIIDQKDDRTGSFDEHKVFVGFASENQVKRTYEAAFSDGRGKHRIGAIREMDIGALKDWLKHGDTTKPVTKAA